MSTRIDTSKSRQVVLKRPMVFMVVSCKAIPGFREYGLGHRVRRETPHCNVALHGIENGLAILGRGLGRSQDR